VTRVGGIPATRIVLRRCVSGYSHTPIFFEGGDARLVEKVCVVCGKKFVASTVKCSVRKTCSNTCYSRWCAARRAERRTDSGSVTV